MSDASKKDKSKIPKVFDVAKPGQSAPASTSKPVIVTNRPVLRDPMTTEDQGQTPDVEPSPANTRVKIMPLSDPETLKKEAAAGSNGDDNSNATPVTDQPAEEATSQDVSKPTDAEVQVPETAGPSDTGEDKAAGSTEQPASQTPDKAEVQETSDTDAAGQDASPTTASDGERENPSESAESATGEGKDISKEEEEAARKEAERAEELRRLADSRKYYLPINEVEKRHRIYAWSTLLVLLLGLLWLDIVLDAGIMKLGNIKAPTHFFSGQQPVTVTSPADTTKLYVSTTDRISFSYPNTWKLSKTSNNDTETVSIRPADPTVPASADLTRNQPFNAAEMPAGQITLADVTYQKLASSNGSVPLYLQQFIAEVAPAVTGQQAHYIIGYNITDAQSFKPGDTVDSFASILGPTFLSPNGKDALNFYGYITAPTTSQSGSPFVSLNDAENFVKTNQNYRQLTVIMRSLKLPKQHT